MKLENWSLVFGELNPYQAPETVRPHLNGEVFGHPRFENGKNVTTSAIVGKKGSNVVTNSGSIYELGTIETEYKKRYPLALERLLNSLPEV